MTLDIIYMYGYRAKKLFCFQILLIRNVSFVKYTKLTLQVYVSRIHVAQPGGIGYQSSTSMLASSPVICGKVLQQPVYGH